MNSSVSLGILTVFDIVILGLGIYFIVAGIRMKKTKELGIIILTEEEVKGCTQKVALAEYFSWRELAMGVVFALFGGIRLLDKYVLKIGGMLDVMLMVGLLVTVMWFYKCIMIARTKFLA